MSEGILRAKRTLFALCAILMLPVSSFAQSGAGAIQGTVQDASSAVVAGCSVHVVNQGTGVAIDTTANGSGFYSVPGVVRKGDWNDYLVEVIGNRYRSRLNGVQMIACLPATTK